MTDEPDAHPYVEQQHVIDAHELTRATAENKRLLARVRDLEGVIDVRQMDRVDELIVQRDEAYAHMHEVEGERDRLSDAIDRYIGQDIEIVRLSQTLEAVRAYARAHPDRIDTDDLLAVLDGTMCRVCQGIGVVWPEDVNDHQHPCDACAGRDLGTEGELAGRTGLGETDADDGTRSHQPGPSKWALRKLAEAQLEVQRLRHMIDQIKATEPGDYIRQVEADRDAAWQANAILRENQDRRVREHADEVAHLERLLTEARRLPRWLDAPGGQQVLDVGGGGELHEQRQAERQARSGSACTWYTEPADRAAGAGECSTCGLPSESHRAEQEPEQDREPRLRLRRVQPPTADTIRRLAEQGIDLEPELRASGVDWTEADENGIPVVRRANQTPE